MGRMRSMKYVRALEAEAVRELEHLHREGGSHRERVRAHAVLLSSQGFSLESLASIFFVDRDTVSRWLGRLAEGGVAALEDAPRPGRPSKLPPQARAMLRESLLHPTPRLAPLLLERLLLERLKKGASACAGRR